mmetsp:Transcript_95233/g.254666  ORF Transcript_95233/g.254666 Transcript_95233/m.254666 type:complete len:769 (-) Transcript_95233:206-2512(-)
MGVNTSAQPPEKLVYVKGAYRGEVKTALGSGVVDVDLDRTILRSNIEPELLDLLEAGICPPPTHTYRIGEEVEVITKGYGWQRATVVGVSDHHYDLRMNTSVEGQESFVWHNRPARTIRRPGSQAFEVGDRVDALTRSYGWQRGIVVFVCGDGTYDLLLDYPIDGSPGAVWHGVDASRLRRAIVYKMGTRVECHSKEYGWIPGTVVGVGHNDTYDVKLDAHVAGHGGVTSDYVWRGRQAELMRPLEVVEPESDMGAELGRLRSLLSEKDAEIRRLMDHAQHAMSRSPSHASAMHANGFGEHSHMQASPHPHESSDLAEENHRLRAELQRSEETYIEELAALERQTQAKFSEQLSRVVQDRTAELHSAQASLAAVRAQLEQALHGYGTQDAMSSVLRAKDAELEHVRGELAVAKDRLHGLEHQAHKMEELQARPTLEEYHRSTETIAELEKTLEEVREKHEAMLRAQTSDFERITQLREAVRKQSVSLTAKEEELAEAKKHLEAAKLECQRLEHHISTDTGEKSSLISRLHEELAAEKARAMTLQDKDEEIRRLTTDLNAAANALRKPRDSDVEQIMQRQLDDANTMLRKVREENTKLSREIADLLTESGRQKEHLHAVSREKDRLEHMLRGGASSTYEVEALRRENASFKKDLEALQLMLGSADDGHREEAEKYKSRAAVLESQLQEATAQLQAEKTATMTGFNALGASTASRPEDIGASVTRVPTSYVTYPRVMPTSVSTYTTGPVMLPTKVVRSASPQPQQRSEET